MTWPEPGDVSVVCRYLKYYKVQYRRGITLSMRVMRDSLSSAEHFAGTDFAERVSVQRIGNTLYMHRNIQS